MILLTEMKDKIKCESCGHDITSIEPYASIESWQSEHGDSMNELQICIVCPNCEHDNYVRSEWE